MARNSEVLNTRVPMHEARALRIVAAADGRTISSLLAHLARRHVAAYVAEHGERSGPDGAEPLERRVEPAADGAG